MNWFSNNDTHRETPFLCSAGQGRDVQSTTHSKRVTLSTLAIERPLLLFRRDTPAGSQPLRYFGRNSAISGNSITRINPMICNPMKGITAPKICCNVM